MRVKNWEKFQHYKKRKPPWIRFYRDLLDDDEFFDLPGEAFKSLAMLWLIAAEDPNMTGELPAIKKLAFRMRTTEAEVQSVISQLSHWVECDASTKLSTCPQHAPSETETETEGETDAPARDQDQEDKDKEAEMFIHPLVALCLELWPSWPQDQIEQSVLVWKSARLNITERILRDAKTSMNPRHPHSKIHTWVVRQAQFAARDVEKGSPRPQPKEQAHVPDTKPQTDSERLEQARQVAEITGSGGVEAIEARRAEKE